MTRFLSELFLLSLFAAAMVHAQAPGKTPGEPKQAGDLPRFEDYPVVLEESRALSAEEATAEEAPAPAPLVFATPESRRFRARLRSAVQDAPNFAGHYVLTTWECGPQCVVGAAVDVRNGEVTWLPEVSVPTSEAKLLKASEPVRFRKDSRLIVFEGARDQKADDHGIHFYEIRGKQLVHVRSVAPQKGNP